MSARVVEPLRVLIVEDDELHARLTAEALRRSIAQPHVEIAADGTKALSVLRGGSGYPTADIVVLDMHLPGLSGQEVLQEIRADETLRLVPVVVLSSSDRPDDVGTAYRAGANAYVTKPAEFPSLARIAEAICTLWGGSARPRSQQSMPSERLT